MNHHRRRFLLVPIALFALQRMSNAQPNSKVWRVGFISGGTRRTPLVNEFSNGMRDLGYELGKSYLIDSRFAEGHLERLAALAADLVETKVDVIVVVSTPAAEAVKRATSTIPVVMAIVGNPVGSGIVASLARPGGNITGLSLANADISTKWFELARTISPHSRIGVLTNTNQSTAPGYIRDIQSAAERIGAKLPVADARSAEEIDGALESLARQRVTTVIVLPTTVFDIHSQKIAQVARTHRMASIASARSYVQGGLLLGYGQNYDAFARRAATYVDKILKGAKPSELPIEQPLLVELSINLRTAKDLNFTIPKELLLRADKVIK